MVHILKKVKHDGNFHLRLVMNVSIILSVILSVIQNYKINETWSEVIK